MRRGRSGSNTWVVPKGQARPDPTSSLNGSGPERRLRPMNRAASVASATETARLFLRDVSSCVRRTLLRGRLAAAARIRRVWSAVTRWTGTACSHRKPQRSKPSMPAITCTGGKRTQVLRTAARWRERAGASPAGACGGAKYQSSSPTIWGGPCGSRKRLIGRSGPPAQLRDYLPRAQSSRLTSTMRAPALTRRQASGSLLRMPYRAGRSGSLARTMRMPSISATEPRRWTAA